MSAPASATFGDLVDRLADVGLRLVAGRRDAPVRSAACVIHDPLVALPRPASGILLGVGLHPDRDAATVLAAADAGFDAVVVRDLDLAGSVMAAAAVEVDVHLLAVDRSVGWTHLEGLISSALSSMDSDLGRPGASGQDLFDLANATAALVGGAVAIEDAGQRMLAHSTLDGQPIDDDRRAGILGRQVPVLPENDEQYAAVLRARSAVHIDGVDGAMDRLAIAVRAGNQLLGAIWVVDADGSLAPGAADALERAADLAALHLLHVRSAADFARHQRARLLRRLFEGGGDARLALDWLGIAPDGPFAVMALGLSLPSDADLPAGVERFVGMVDTYCAGMQLPGVVAVLESTVYVFAHGPLADDPGRLEAMARLFVQRAEVLGLDARAGIGQAVSRPDAVGRCRDEADLLLLLPPGAHGVTTTWQARSRLSLLGLARHLHEHGRLKSPAAVAILEHDRLHRTSYGETLMTWFDHRMSTTATSTALAVHANTLRYRLQRIATLFQVDLASADDLLVLWLTLRAARFDG